MQRFLRQSFWHDFLQSVSEAELFAWLFARRFAELLEAELFARDF